MKTKVCLGFPLYFRYSVLLCKRQTNTTRWGMSEKLSRKGREGRELISVYRSRILKSTLLLGNLTSFCSCFLFTFFFFFWFFCGFWPNICCHFLCFSFCFLPLSFIWVFFASFCLLIACVCELVCVCYGFFYVYCVWNMFGIKVGPFPGIKSFITAHRIRELWFQCLCNTHTLMQCHTLWQGDRCSDPFGATSEDTMLWSMRDDDFEWLTRRKVNSVRCFGLSIVLHRVVRVLSALVHYHYYY